MLSFALFLDIQKRWLPHYMPWPPTGWYVHVLINKVSTRKPHGRPYLNYATHAHRIMDLILK